jgi:DNA-binding transcriptional MocR family regulator
VSWKALDWATDSEVGSSTRKFILLLLANKAENFSCYPSIRTLMAESGAARSPGLEALKGLEVEGLITRVAEYHESGPSDPFAISSIIQTRSTLNPVKILTPGSAGRTERVSFREREGPGSGPPGVRSGIETP